jgi:hypothetical protein
MSHCRAAESLTDMANEKAARFLKPLIDRVNPDV